MRTDRDMVSAGFRTDYSYNKMSPLNSHAHYSSWVIANLNVQIMMSVLLIMQISFGLITYTEWFLSLFRDLTIQKKIIVQKSNSEFFLMQACTTTHNLWPFDHENHCFFLILAKFKSACCGIPILWHAVSVVKSYKH